MVHSKTKAYTLILECTCPLLKSPNTTHVIVVVLVVVVRIAVFYPVISGTAYQLLILEEKSLKWTCGLVTAVFVSSTPALLRKKLGSLFKAFTP